MFFFVGACRQIRNFDIGEYKQWRTAQAAGQTESLFKEFEGYNFDGDDKFQAGLQTVVRELVQRGITGSLFGDEVRKVKLFYFSRLKGHPLDYAAYKAWSGHRQAEELKASGPACPYGYSSKPSVVEESPVAAPPALEGKSCPYGFSALPASVDGKGTEDTQEEVVKVDFFSTLMEKITVNFETATMDDFSKGLEKVRAGSQVNSILISSSGEDSNASSFFSFFFVLCSGAHWQQHLIDHEFIDRRASLTEKKFSE